MTSNVLRAAAWRLAAALVVAATVPAWAQDAKPAKTIGITVADSSTLPLEAQIPELAGYALQIRTIVLEPGATSPYHSHANRPVVAYLISGDYTEHRDGEGIVVHQPGEQWVEGANVAHWSENRGSEAAYLINVELIRRD